MSAGELDVEGTIDDRMDVEMSFLDAFRTGGSDALRKAHDQVRAQEQAEKDAATASGEHGGSDGGQGSGDAADGSVAGLPASDSTGLDEDGKDADSVRDEHLDLDRDRDEDDETPVSLQFTDHQDAVQSAAASRGGSGGGGDDSLLPTSGFRLGGVTRQPHIKSLPESIIGQLREQLRAAAVRELGVDDRVAREFSDRVSQGTLVTAFLLSQLDIELEADPATVRAAQLFRSQDPLLGMVAERMEALDQRERHRASEQRRMREELKAVRETSAVLEQLMAYTVADRTENFLRGSHDITAAPITHKSAVFIRDRARDATRKQQQLEQEREGRPIR